MSWFSKPHTWDELKKQKEAYEEENHKLRHKVRELESELEVSKQLVEAKVEIAVEKAEARHQKELLSDRVKLEQDYQKRMTEYLLKVNTEGNAQTKFVQDMALEMVRKAPSNLKQIGE